MLWLSIALAITIGVFTLLNITIGLGLQIIAVALAGNAFVRLQRGTPAKTRFNVGATWLAIAISVVALAIGLYRIAVPA